MSVDLQLGTLEVHNNGKPVKQGKGGLPRTPVREAMRSNAVESRAWIQDVLYRIKFADYAGRTKIQVFEATLYLAACEFFEEGSDLFREGAFKSAGVELNLEECRASELYTELLDRIAAEAKKLREEEDADPSLWVERETALAQKVLSRTLRHTLSTRELATAAGEVLDRRLPKATRAQGGGQMNIVIFRPEDAALMEKAMRTINGDSKPVLELTP